MENNNNTMTEDNNDATQSTNDTFMALVDAIIPRSPILAQVYGEIMYYGALDLYVDEYLVMLLSDGTTPLFQLTAEILNIAARQYLMEAETQRNRNRFQENRNTVGEDAIFQNLSRRERFRAMMLLEQIETYFSNEVLFKKYPGLITIASSIIRFTMLGYYSEWFGYGTTRLNPPSQRVFEFAPISWEQVNYPGPSQSHLEEVKEYYAIKERREIES